jgi:hypothetical protein
MLSLLTVTSSYTSYQFIVPAVAVASKVRVPESQREVGVVEDIVGADNVAVTAVRVMLLQAAALASA